MHFPVDLNQLQDLFDPKVEEYGTFWGEDIYSYIGKKDFIIENIENVQQYKEKGDRKKAANEVYRKFLEDEEYKQLLDDAKRFFDFLSNNKKISKKYRKYFAGPS